MAGLAPSMRRPGGGPDAAGPGRWRGARAGLRLHRPQPDRPGSVPDDGRAVHRLGRPGPGRAGDQRRDRAPVRLALGLPGPAAGGRDHRVDGRCPRCAGSGRRAPARAEVEHRLVDGVRTAGWPRWSWPASPWPRARARSPPPWRAGPPWPCSGGLAGLPALRRLVPAGTLTARRGLPTTILVPGPADVRLLRRGRLCDADDHRARHRSPLLAGIAVTGATLTWTAGVWIQARLGQHRAGPPTGAHRAGDHPGRHRRDAPGAAVGRAGGRRPGRVDGRGPGHGAGLSRPSPC